MASEPQPLPDVPFHFMERALREFAEDDAWTSYDEATPSKPWAELSPDVKTYLVTAASIRITGDDARMDKVDARARQMADAAYQSAKASHFDARLSRAQGK